MTPFAKGSKYRRYVGLNDIADRTYNGDIYDSIKERNHAALLDQLKKAKDPKDRVVAFTRQVYVPLHVNGKLVCSMFLDFHVVYADGRIQYEEVKGGYRNDTWALKHKLFKAVHPDKTLKIIR